MSEQEKCESTDKRAEQLQTELQKLRHEVTASIHQIDAQLTPHELAKKIDQSYFSINAVRVILQAVSILFTIFAGILGILAVYGLIDFRNFANKLSDTENRVGAANSNVTVLISKAATLDSNITALANKAAILETDFDSRVNQAEAKGQQRFAELQSAISNSVVKVQANVEIADQRLSEQQQKLRDIQVTIFENETHDKIDHKDKERIWFGRKSDGAFVSFYKLKKAPIAQTIELKVGDKSLMQGDYQLFGYNILAALWTSNSETQTRETDAIVRYIADPRKEGKTSAVIIDKERKRLGVDTDNVTTWIVPMTWLPREGE